MADNKKYYYMRLKENFFDSPELKTIESMRGGYKYSNILLKLYLLSLRDEGRLTFRKDIPYDINMLSNLTGFSKTEVENALKIFRKFNLIDILDTGTIYMLDIQDLIGKSSTEADRKKEYRARIEREKAGHLSEHLSNNCPPEIETEQKKETHIETEGEKEKEEERECGREEEERKECESKPGTIERAFDILWNHYPKKSDKEAAFEEIKTLPLIKDGSLDRDFFNMIASRLIDDINSSQWQEENGRYIPKFVNWLKNRPWENKLPPKPRPYEGYKRFT